MANVPTKEQINLRELCSVRLHGEGSCWFPGWCGRGAQRLSQAKLVLRCQLAGFDISRESLAKVEGGWRVVSDLEVLLLADALGVPFTSLFPPPEDAAALIRSFRAT